MSLTSFTGQQSATMSSREIADLVESRHDSVKRTIERCVEKAAIVQPPTVDEQSSDALGRARITQVYQLDKRSSLIVVAQLCPEFTARIVDRWQELELAQPPKALPVPTQAATLIEADLHIANLLGVPIHLAQVEAVKHARLSTGYDVTHLLQHAPAQSSIPDNDIMLEPTELARELGYSSAVSMNKALAEAGLQVRNFDKWQAIGFGAKISAVHHWSKGGKSGYNLKWSVAKVRQALEAA
jgi:phage regulator Rha-like protein